MSTETSDAIVVGGGIVGCLTAYLLAREGLSVTLLEADAVGSHASGFAFGELGVLDGAGLPHPLLDFSVWSFRQHEPLAAELSGVSGVPNYFQRSERLKLAFDGGVGPGIQTRLGVAEEAVGLSAPVAQSGGSGQGGAYGQPQHPGGGARRWNGLFGAVPVYPGRLPGGRAGRARKCPAAPGNGSHRRRRALLGRYAGRGRTIGGGNGSTGPGSVDRRGLFMVRIRYTGAAS